MWKPVRSSMAVAMIVSAVLAAGCAGADHEVSTSATSASSLAPSEEPPATSGDGPTASVVPASTQLPTEHASLPDFDVDAFLLSKLGGDVFEGGDQVAVVVLVPADLEADFEVVVASTRMTELEGYSYIPAQSLAAAAERFAAANETSLLEGRWVAYGLIPRFADSPFGAWAAILSGTPGIHLAKVRFNVPTTQTREGWDVVADLPFGITSGAIVEPVNGGVVVVQHDSTHLITEDGSWIEGELSPLPIASACCGSVSGMSAGDSLVLINESTPESWILDVDTMTWREAEPRPALGYALGSVLIDRQLTVVIAADRTENAISPVIVLDVETGEWSELEPVPSPISVGGVTNDGHRLIVAGTRQGPNNNVIGDRNPLAFDFIEARGWSEMEDIPIDGQASTVVWIVGTGLLAWNYDLDSSLLGPNGVWASIGEVPMPPGECYPKASATLGGAVGLCGGVARFDSATAQWTQIHTSYNTRVVVAQSALLGLVTLGRDQIQLVRYKLTATDS